MILKHIFNITFLNKPELVFCWHLNNLNNSVKHNYSFFVYTQLNIKQLDSKWFSLAQVHSFLFNAVSHWLKTVFCLHAVKYKKQFDSKWFSLA